MRHRATIALLLAALFSLIPLWQWHEQQIACIANRGGLPDVSDTVGAGLSTDAPVCSQYAPPTLWIYVLGVIAVLCFVAFLFFFLQGILARRREQAFLHAAGVDVPESDLPIEE